MDKDLGLLLQHPELLKFVGQLNPMYNSGRELGASGREPPMDLNQVTRIKQKKREDPFSFLNKGKEEKPFFNYPNYSLTDILQGKEARREPEVELDSAKASFRQGYVDGLKQFMDSRGIDVVSTGLFRGTDVISTDGGLVGFVRGARLESPSIPRNYNPARRESKKYLFNEPEPDFVAEMRFKNMVTQEGYKLGFIVGIARDHGVVLKGDVLKCDVPMDDASYRAFKQGLEGEERQLPVETLRLESRDLYMIKEENPLVAEMRAFEWVDNQAYHTGLQIWLKSQGAEGVSTWQVRHPTALRAFKVALQGQTLSEYEPKQIRDEFGFGKRHGEESLLKKFYLQPKESLFGDKFRTEPNPVEIARQQGQAGYDLGKAVRLVKR